MSAVGGPLSAFPAMIGETATTVRGGRGRRGSRDGEDRADGHDGIGRRDDDDVALDDRLEHAGAGRRFGASERTALTGTSCLRRTKYSWKPISPSSHVSRAFRCGRR